MTDKEMLITRMLGDAWNLFCELEPEHASDRLEFSMAIHQAQNIIMSRPTIRLMREERAKGIGGNANSI